MEIHSTVPKSALDNSALDFEGNIWVIGSEKVYSGLAGIVNIRIFGHLIV